MWQFTTLYELTFSLQDPASARLSVPSTRTAAVDADREMSEGLSKWDNYWLLLG